MHATGTTGGRPGLPGRLHTGVRSVCEVCLSARDACDRQGCRPLAGLAVSQAWLSVRTPETAGLQGCLSAQAACDQKVCRGGGTAAYQFGVLVGSCRAELRVVSRRAECGALHGSLSAPGVMLSPRRHAAGCRSSRRACCFSPPRGSGARADAVCRSRESPSKGQVLAGRRKRQGETRARVSRDGGQRLAEIHAPACPDRR
jgi:hypothetical protein